MRRFLGLGLLFLMLTACDDGDDGDRSPSVDATLRQDSSGGGGGGEAGSGGGGGGVVGQTCPRTFAYFAGAATPGEVKVAGPFTGWGDGAVAMVSDGAGFYTATIDLTPGDHPYKFIVDGEWIPDPYNPRREGEDLNTIAAHTCPFEPACVTDADCAEAAPHCRDYVCHDVPPAPLDCRCAEGLFCGPDGGCVECDAAHPCQGTSVCRQGACGPECLTDEECAGEALCGPDLTCVEPECVVDDDCGDILTLRCENHLCLERSCREQVFLFDPQGAQYVSVHVAGSFNGWPAEPTTGLTMSWRVDLGRWFAVSELEVGSYEYKFVADGSWMPTPECQGETASCDPNPTCVNDTYNGCNSVVTIECAPEVCDPPCEDNQICQRGACVAAPPSECGDLSTFDWADAVMYFIMVDRFYNSDGQSDPVQNATGGDAAWGPSGQYEGGDLQGVTAKIPYLKDLGVSAVWLSAPYNNREAAGASMSPDQDRNLYSGYHGYWPAPDNIDYSDPDNPSPEPAVESRIGTSSDLHGFIDSAHNEDMMVLFDYVMNHIDVDSGLFQAHPEWFYQENGRFRLCGNENLWDDEFYGVRCAFTDYLPPFDFDNEDARRWSINDALWWAKAYGIDGFRLDAIKHVPLNWLTDLRRELNAQFANPAGGRFYLVGETFDYFNRDLLKRFVNPATMLDGQFDFPFKKEACEAVFHDGGSLQNFAGWMDGNDGYYGPGSLMTTWIGNHDIPRVIHFANREFGCTDGSNTGNGWTNNYHQPENAEPYERLGVVFAIMMTNPGIPLIYYGDEIGLAGGGDPDNRRVMHWEGLNAHQEALRDKISKLAKIRAEYKSLARGRRVRIGANQNTWVYRMGCGGAVPALTVAINKADFPNTVQIPGGDYTDLMTDAAVSGGEVALGARSFMILLPR
ncbi:hypothetical protein KKB55_14465 [Myxococcota bacterium]|nr:hypothetical protein [Myxococcota bacterium]MBU1898939.1 hypothetical protein [Myxococcota bacterium]